MPARARPPSPRSEIRCGRVAEGTAPDRRAAADGLLPPHGRARAWHTTRRGRWVWCSTARPRHPWPKPCRSSPSRPATTPWCTPAGRFSPPRCSRWPRAASGPELIGPEQVGEDVGPLRVFAGYAGWAPGQLDGEIEEDAWITLPAEPDDPFAETDLWAEVLQRKGGGYVADGDDARRPVPELARSPARPGRTPRCRPGRSSRSGSSRGTAGGSPRRRRTRPRPRSPW